MSEEVHALKQKHTPGPWEQCKPGSVRYITTRGLDIANVFSVNHETGEDIPEEANARLIAAAPMLLEACRAALSLLEDLLLSGRPIPKFSDKSEVLHQLNEAIAFATLPGLGEDPWPASELSSELSSELLPGAGRNMRGDLR